MKSDLALNLSTYNFRERWKINRAARMLRKFAKLTGDKLTKEEELADAIEELENE